MSVGMLGKTYQNGERIVSQGEVGDSMFVIQAGRVQVFMEEGGSEIPLSVLEAGEVFGEMALFSREPRAATVRALGEARILTIDKKGFFKWIHQDPSLALRILQKMSERIRKLNDEIVELRQQAGGGGVSKE